MSIAAGNLQGQIPEREPRTPPVAGDFQVGQYVRVTAPGIVIDGGLIQSILGDTLFVVSEGLQWSVQTSQIEAIDVRVNKAVGKAVGGFAIGALLGIASEFVLHKGDGCNDRFRECPASYGRNILIVGGLGAVIGLVVANTTTYWRQIFP